MNFEWQEILVGVALAAAIMYLAIQVRRFLRPKAACGGGCGCPSTPAQPKERQLIGLTAPRPKSPSENDMGSQPR